MPYMEAVTVEILESRKLLFINYGEIKFPIKFKDKVGFKNLLFIILDVSEFVYNNNLICVDKESSKLLWQIDSKNFSGDDCPVEGVFINDGEVSFYRWCGWSEKIDLQNGKLVSRKLVK